MAKTFRHVHYGAQRPACGVDEPGVLLAITASSVSCPLCYRLAMRAIDEAPDIARVLTLCRRLGTGRVVQIASDASEIAAVWPDPLEQLGLTAGRRR